jgi:hypothetical protein
MAKRKAPAKVRGVYEREPGSGVWWICYKQGSIRKREKVGTVRTLLKINLFEISPCSFAAYPAANVSLRSCPRELRSQLRSNFDDEDECVCDCAECADGNCDDCEFDHEDRSNLVSQSEIRRMHMRLTLARHK